MSSPTTAIQRLELSASFSEFDLAADRGEFIATRALRGRPVAKNSGSLPKIPLEQLLQSPETLRAPRSGYARNDFTFDLLAFVCEEHGFEQPLDDAEAAMYLDLIQGEVIASQKAIDGVLRKLEITAASLLFNATTWTGAALTTVVTNEWDKNHATDAVPIDDVEAARMKVWEGSGLWPNALIISKQVFHNLRNIDQIIERISGTGAGFPTRARDITPQQLAEVFDLDYVLVGGGTKNTAKEGQAAVLAPIWSNEYAMIARVATTADPAEPTVGRLLVWPEDSLGTLGSDGAIAMGIEQYREESRRGDVYRARMWYCAQLLYKEAAHLFSNITT